MKKAGNIFLILTFAFIGLDGSNLFAQPEDLRILASSGGQEPSSEIRTLLIRANGEGLFAAYFPLNIGEPLLEERSFTVTPTQLAKLWEAIQTNNFFNLQPLYDNPEFLTRTSARLVIRAGGQQHEVITQNIAVDPFDNIIQVLNDITPGDADLVYDTSIPLFISPHDPCNVSSEVNLSPNNGALLSSKTKEQNLQSSSLAKASEFGGAHGGTAVAYRMTLEEAVDFGIAKLRAKGRGNIFGDEVEITVDNTGYVRNDKLTLSFYVAFWGEEAVPDVVDNIISQIHGSYGGFKTSLNEPLNVEIRAKISSELRIPPDHHIISLRKNRPFETQNQGVVNNGTTQGSWGVGEGSFGGNAFAPFAHYAGHLLGLDDLYDEFIKRNLEGDEIWYRLRNPEFFTSAQLAQLMNASRPDLSLSEIQEFLDNPSILHVYVPYAGFESHVMAWPLIQGRPTQSDIDEITMNAGIIVEVRPGQILVNANDDSQNLVITHNVDLYVAPGQIRTLEGIYAACIDNHRSVPRRNEVMHLAPPLDSWTQIDGAAALMKLVQYIDEHQMYCENDFLSQIAIWRLTDNVWPNDPEIDYFLLNAEVVANGRVFDFPRLDGSAISSNNGTVSFVPLELFTSRVEPNFLLVRPGDTVDLNSLFSAPSGIEDFTTQSAWVLEKPEGSSAAILSDEASAASLDTDVRGIYHVRYDVDISEFEGNQNNFLARPVGGWVLAHNGSIETFELGELDIHGFNWRTRGEIPWRVTSKNVQSGNYSATTSTLYSGSGELETDISMIDSGTMAFSYSVMSSASDFLVFYIDGIEKDRWAGTVEWTQIEYELDPGQHTLRWVFNKGSSRSDNTAFIDDIFFPENTIFTSVGSFPRQNPTAYELMQNFPNPFNPSTTIQYSIPQGSLVSLKIYDTLGREIATLINEDQAQGVYEIKFDAKGLPGGVYFYSLRAGRYSDTKKFVLIK